MGEWGPWMPAMCDQCYGGATGWLQSQIENLQQRRNRYPEIQAQHGGKPCSDYEMAENRQCKDIDGKIRIPDL